MNHLVAPRTIPATPALCKEWVGPLRVTMYGREWVRTAARYTDAGVTIWDDGGSTLVPWCDVHLDPFRPEVRDHLVRHFDLPEWLHDSQDGIAAWVAAGLVWCAAMGIEPRALFDVWEDDDRYEGLRSLIRGRVPVGVDCVRNALMNHARFS